MPADPNATRRQTDIAKLKELEAEYRGIVSMTRTVGNPITMIEVELRLKTARNAGYPSETQETSKVEIQLPGRYPFESPQALVKTPVWNPNIWADGRICLGLKWIPTQNLAMLVERVMQILAFDPVIINVNSPANVAANNWYKEAKQRNPALFPTVKLETLKTPARPTIQWRTIK